MGSVGSVVGSVWVVCGGSDIVLAKWTSAYN